VNAYFIGFVDIINNFFYLLNLRKT